MLSLDRMGSKERDRNGHVVIADKVKLAGGMGGIARSYLHGSSTWIFPVQDPGKIHLGARSTADSTAIDPDRSGTCFHGWIPAFLNKPILV